MLLAFVRTMCASVLAVQTKHQRTISLRHYNYAAYPLHGIL